LCTGWNFGEGQDRRRLPVLAAGRPRRDRLRDRAEHPHSGNNLRLRVRLYRKHVNHETRRNFQLDLFTPDDGHYEYSAVATNLPLGLSALWAFRLRARGQEKTFAGIAAIMLGAIFLVHAQNGFFTGLPVWSRGRCRADS
jgi:hypothetical protein